MGKGLMGPLGLLFVALLLVSCAGKIVAPPQAPAPTPAPGAVAPVPTPTAEDAAWAKVVEAAKKEGKVVGYSATGLCCDGGQAIGQAFRQKYGITLDLLSTAARQGVERITVEQGIGQPVADWLSTGGTSMTEALAKGLLVGTVELPVLRDRSVFVVNPVFSPGGEILQVGPNTTSLLINAARVKPEDYPSSYRDLLHPKWKEQIIMEDAKTQGGGTAVLYIATSFYKSLDDDFWRALMKQKPALWGGSGTEIYRMLARGEYLVSLAGGGLSAAPLIAEGAPLRGLAMEEGAVSIGFMIGQAKNSPHPNATRVFLNWLFSQEGQEVYARATSRQSLRKDVSDYTPPGARLQPKRILDRTWEVAKYGNELDWPRILGQVFGVR